MPITYTKLFELMKEKNIQPSDFRYKKILSSATITKLRKNQRVSLTVLETLCEELRCGLDDIAEFVPSKSNATSLSPDPVAPLNPLSEVTEPDPQPDNSTREAIPITKKEAPDNDIFVISKSGFYYQKSALERDKINLPHKFETNARYPYICPETGYAYRITDFGAFERSDNPEK